jgi:hypothetical protein
MADIGSWQVARNRSPTDKRPFRLERYVPLQPVTRCRSSERHSPATSRSRRGDHGSATAAIRAYGRHGGD